jgi:UDP-N-acetylmuramyl pentapeptide phosphotransferase/UDP-N-acetylglucosamine-1-phosphate transferase
VPTPQGAGLAVMFAVLAGCGLGLLVAPAQPGILGVLTAAAGLTMLGAIDDAYGLSVSSRLGGQFLATLVLIGTLPEELRLFPDLMPAGMEDALLVLGIMWFVNAVNFLDGLDWMMVAQAVPMTLGIAVLYALGIVPGTIGLLALTLLGAMLGFAVFNKHPAQIFLGDAGSLPIGFLLAFMLMFVAQTNLVSAFLLALYTLSDATLTLLRRMANKERIFSAHKSHYYQRAVAQGFSVPQVTTRIFLLESGLALLAVLAALSDSTAISLSALALGVIATALTLRHLARGGK